MNKKAIKMKYSLRICAMCYLSGALGWLAAARVIGLKLAVPERIKTRVETRQVFVIQVCAQVIG